MKKGWIFVVGFLMLTELFAGWGWPQKKRGYFMKLGTYSIIANKYFTPAGHLVDITTTGYYSTSYYVEYGFSEKLTAIANVPFFVRSTLNQINLPDGTLYEAGDELNSFGDVDLSLKYGWLKTDKVVSAISLTLGLPLGNSSGGNTKLLQSGDGEFNQLLEGYLSSSIFKGRGFGTLTLGYNNRTKDFTNEVRYGVEIGYKVKSVWMILRSYGIKPVNDDSDDFVSNNGIFSNRVEYLSISPEVLVEVTDRLGVSASAGFAAYGKRILGSPSFSVGVFLKK